MNAISEVARPNGNEIVALVEANPVMVLTDAKKFSEFYEAMRRETDALDADVATERGRKAIASMAYKVARTKTAIDEAGKKLNEEARARINAVDESRREIRKQLDDLKDEVRRPLTAWEEAEAAREVLAAETLAKIREKGRVELEDTVATVKARLDELSSLTINPEVHGDATGVAEAARTDAIAALQSAHDRLEKLRAEAAERERKEQEAREAAEVERRRAESEAAEKVRLEAIARAAEERARIEAERVAKEEREAAERAHAEALAAERRRAEEAERAAQAERDAAARAEAERVAAAEREAAEQARRDADRAHRSKVMGAAKEAIMEAGEVDEAAAKRIVLAIAAGSVPAISIRF
jgi:colicin import membrane protein